MDVDESDVSAASVTSFLEEDTLEDTRCRRLDLERLCLQSSVSGRLPKPSSFPMPTKSDSECALVWRTSRGKWSSSYPSDMAAARGGAVARSRGPSGVRG